MTRSEAWAALLGTGYLDFTALDDIFLAFGFTSSSPTFEIQIYYHPRYSSCGAFTARDDGHHGVSPMERDLAAKMIGCVLASEQTYGPDGGVR